MAGFRDLGAAAVGHRAIPHPAVTLALDFGEGRLVVDDGEGRRTCGSVAAGLGFGAHGMHVRGIGFEAVQVRLSPVLARAVLGVSPADLGEGAASLDDLWGQQASLVREQLSEAGSWEQRFAVVEALLTSRHEAAAAVDPEVAWAWRRILRTRGRVRIDELAAELGWSRKRLWTRFRSQIGLAPKGAATLVRFDRAVHRLAAGGVAADVAAECGYADQSHLHRDVRAFARATPATVAREPWLAVDDVVWPRRVRGAVDAG